MKSFISQNPPQKPSMYFADHKQRARRPDHTKCGMAVTGDGLTFSKVVCSTVCGRMRRRLSSHRSPLAPGPTQLHHQRVCDDEAAYGS